MDEKLLSVLLSTASALLVLLATRILARRQDKAKAESDAGNAAESVATAGRTLVETYNKEVVQPLRNRIDDLVQQLSVVEEDRHTEQVRFQDQLKELQLRLERVQGQVEFMKGELRRSDSALEFILSVTRDAYPEQSQKALRIRRGEL